MKTISVKKGVINAALASGANVKNDAASGPYLGMTIICENNAVTPPVEIIKPIVKGHCIQGVKQNSQAEVSQMVFVGRATETIVANTRYRIELWNGLEYEKERQSPFKFAYTSDAVLSGTASIDRVNVFTALMNKINAYAPSHATAYVVSKVAYTIGDTAVPVVGEIITQTTSTATAMIVAVNQTSGTITGGDGAGTLYLVPLTGTWVATSKVSTGGTSGAVMTTAALVTAGEGLFIVDNAGYYGSRPNGQRVKSDVQLTQGFTIADVEALASTIAVGATTGLATGLPGVYSFGIGTRMLQDVPVFTPDGTQLVSGEAGFQTNQVPLAGTTYRAFWMEMFANPSDTNIDHSNRSGATYWVVLWVNEDSGNTKVDAFETALESSLGITFA